MLHLILLAKSYIPGFVAISSASGDKYRTLATLNMLKCRILSLAELLSKSNKLLPRTGKVEIHRPEA